MTSPIPDGWYRITTADNRFHVFANPNTPSPRPLFAHRDQGTVWYAQRLSGSGEPRYRISQQGTTDVIDHRVHTTPNAVWVHSWHGQSNQTWRITPVSFPGLEGVFTLSPLSATNRGLTMPNPYPGAAPTPLQVDPLPASGVLPPARQLFRFVRVATRHHAAALQEGASDEDVEKYVSNESLEFDAPSFEPLAGVDIDIFAEAAPAEEAK